MHYILFSLVYLEHWDHNKCYLISLLSRDWSRFCLSGPITFDKFTCDLREHTGRRDFSYYATEWDYQCCPSCLCPLQETNKPVRSDKNSVFIKVKEKYNVHARLETSNFALQVQRYFWGIWNLSMTMGCCKGRTIWIEWVLKNWEKQPVESQQSLVAPK